MHNHATTGDAAQFDEVVDTIISGVSVIISDDGAKISPVTGELAWESVWTLIARWICEVSTGGFAVWRLNVTICVNMEPVWTSSETGERGGDSHETSVPRLDVTNEEGIEVYGSCDIVPGGRDEVARQRRLREARILPKDGCGAAEREQGEEGQQEHVWRHDW
ncbi:copper-zinc superoxide dismutase CuZn SOD2 [Gracilaria domingensis]|nr:copper-zinc superoxide dismutase CuZn SOD2 [Gracilaria domingensis]